MIDADVLEQTDIDTKEGEDNQLAHYAESASVVEGYVMGTPVEALCGKIFIPSKNPERSKICPICKEIADSVFFF